MKIGQQILFITARFFHKDFIPFRVKRRHFILIHVNYYGWRPQRPICIYYINHVQLRALGSLALSILHTVFGHGLRNLCHWNGAERPGEAGETDGCRGELEIADYRPDWNGLFLLSVNEAGSWYREQI